jgi:hypothetical protein
MIFQADLTILCVLLQLHYLLFLAEAHSLGLMDEKNFSRGISLPQNFQRAFYMQIEKVE